MNRYRLEIESTSNIDLRDTYIQYFHDEKLDDILSVDGKVVRSMLNSPHYELASLYYRKGLKWLSKNYTTTKYYKFRSKVLNKKGLIPVRKLGLFDSIKKGYLREGFESGYIVVLNKPLIVSRYSIKNLNLNSPEVFMGHHRVGALLALGINKAKVIIAKDIRPSTRDIYGKLSQNYRKVL